MSLKMEINVLRYTLHTCAMEASSGILLGLATQHGYTQLPRKLKIPGTGQILDLHKWLLVLECGWKY